MFKYAALDMAAQGFASQDLHNTSTERTTQRAEFSDYRIFPTKFKFPRIVRILAICTKYVRACKRSTDRRKQKTPSNEEPPTFFNCFLSDQRDLMSSPITDNTEFHAKPLTILYDLISSYYQKFEVTCDKARGTH